ncbi:hypothetical protein GCM10023223_34840 [Stackebrandtia albiflava]
MWRVTGRAFQNPTGIPERGMGPAPAARGNGRGGGLGFNTDKEPESGAAAPREESRSPAPWCASSVSDEFLAREPWARIFFPPSHRPADEKNRRLPTPELHTG